MANKGSVEDILVQFFGSELVSTTQTHSNVITITNDWINNKSKDAEVLIDNNDAASEESPEFKVSTTDIKISNCSMNDYEQLFRLKQTTTLDLIEEINGKDANYTSNTLDTNLLVCLWVLGNTKSFSEIANLLEITQEQVHNICEVYFKKIVSISSKYIYWPGNTEIVAIEKAFFTEYKFPGVVGVIGSLHIAVNVEKNEPAAQKYFNKNTKNHTIVLQAVCDNNNLFRDILAGYPGSNTIGTILKASSLYKILTDEDNLLIKTKKHLLGGTEHPQLSTLLTPYREQRKLTERQLKFNALHGSVMYTVENTFRMIENRFPRIRSLDTTSPKFATLAVAAICTLHNFCRLRNDFTCC